MKITTLVLAGGPADEVARSQDVINKAFVRVAGTPLVVRTLEALRAAPGIGRIIVVAPESTHDDPVLRRADERRPDGKRITDSLANGLAGLPPDEPVLVSASDLPVLSVASIEDYLAQAARADADLTYGCLEKAAHMAAFPTVPHTWAKLRDGTFCGAGFITIRPAIYPKLAEFLEQLGAARKRPLQLASLFGWNMLARYVTGQLTIARAEARASQLLKARVRAIITPFPEMAVNVDRLSDVALAEALIARASPTA